MTTRLPHALAALLAYSFCYPAFATDDDLLFDIPVVLSASRLDQPVSETPLAVTSIDRQQIEASGARNIPDILRMVPGIQVGYSLNEFGDEPRVVVTYHGHSDQYSRQLQVLVDGRSIYEPVLGGVNWNSVPVNIDDIERIEVMRGPNASTFGSNSFLAVINIITRHAAEDSGHYVRLNAGEHSIGDATYRFADSSGETDYRITLTSYNDDGVEHPDGNDIYDDIGANTIDYRIDHQLNDQSSLTYQGGYSNSMQQAREGTRADSFTTARKIENISAYQFLRFETNIDEHNQVKAQYYYNLFDKTDNFSAPITLAPLALDDASIAALTGTFVPGATGTLTIDPFSLEQSEGFKSERHNLEVTHYFDFNDETRLVWGGGVQKDIGNSAYFFNQLNDVSREIHRLFSNMEMEITSDINLNLGLLWEDSDLVGSNTSPRAALIGKLNEEHTIRLGYSEAIRTLFLVEQFAEVLLTQTVTGTITVDPPVSLTAPFSETLIADVIRSTNMLQAEHIRAREIAWYAKPSSGNTLFSVRAFRNTISNLIDNPTIVSTVQVFPGEPSTVDTFQNLHSTVVKGMEIELDHRLNDTTRIISNATLLNIDGRFNPADATPTHTVSNLAERALEYHHSAPDKSFNFMLIKDFANSPYSASFRLNVVGDMAWLDANRTRDYTGERNTGGYRKLDLRLARNWQQSDYDVTLALNLQNVLESYNDYDDQPTLQASRYHKDSTAYLELRISYH